MKQKLQNAFSELKTGQFRTWKKGKRWLVAGISLLALGGGIVVIADTVGVNGNDGTPLSGANTYGNVSLSGTFAGKPQSTQEWVGRLSVNGKDAWCVDPFTALDSNAQATQNVATDTWNGFSTEGKQKISAINDLAEKDGAEGDINMYLAAQYDDWAAEGVNVDSFSNATGGADYATIQADEKKLEDEYQNLLTKPSFDGTTLTIIAGRDASLTDTKGVLGNYSVKSATDGLSVSSSGNTLKVSATSDAKSGTVTLKTQATQAEPLVWGTVNPDGTVGQNLVNGVPLQVTATLNVKVIPLGSIKIEKTQTKQNAAQGSGPVAGSTYDLTVYQSDGKTGDTAVNGTYSGVTFKDGVATGVKTGTDGTVSVKDFAPVGDVVKANETAVPAPYTLGHTDSTGKLTNEAVVGTIQEDSTGTTTLGFTDNKEVGGLKIVKSGVLSGNQMLDANYSLAGNTFVVKNKTGDVVETLTTDSSGNASSADNPLATPLVVGETYTIEETKASTGFVNTFGTKSVSFTYKGANTVIDWESVSGTNQEILGADEIDKVDSVTGTTDTEGEASLSGTTFKYIYNADVLASDGTTILHHKGDIVNLKDGFSKAPIKVTKGTLTTTNGDLIVKVDNSDEVAVENLPAGEYARVEVMNGYGYTKNTTVYPLTVTKKDDETKRIENKQTVKDNVDTWSLRFTKVQEDNGSLIGLNGSEWTFTPESGSKGKAVTVVSGAGKDASGYTMNGLVSFDNLPIENGVFKETKTPDGLQAAHDIAVVFTPKTTLDGAPSQYVATFTDTTTQQVLATETVEASTLTDDKSSMFQLNLGAIADKPVPQPTIATHAHTANGTQTITQGEIGKATEMEDDILLTNANLGNQLVAHLHRIEEDDKGNVKSDAIIATLNFTVDDASVKSEEAKVQTKVDTTKDDEHTRYVWTEDEYAPKVDVKTATPIAKHEDLKDKNQTLTPAKKPAPTPQTPTPKTPATPKNVVNILLPHTGEHVPIWETILGWLLVLSGVGAVIWRIEKRTGKLSGLIDKVKGWIA